jgi:hypothetical protein
MYVKNQRYTYSGTRIYTKHREETKDEPCAARIQELVLKKEYFVNRIWDFVQYVTYPWEPVPELDKTASKVLAHMCLVRARACVVLTNTC